MKATVDGQLAVRGTLTFAVGDGAERDREDERPADLDHGPRRACAGARAHERRPLEARRHERRVDPRAHGDQRAAHRRRGRGAHRHLPAGRAPCARDGRRRSERRSTCSIVATVTPDMAFPVVERAARRHARHARRRGLRPLGRLHRVRLRDRAGARDARLRPGEARARRRRRRALEDPRLDRPLDARALRRRRRCRRDGARRRRRLSRLRARRRRRRRREPLAARAPVRGSSRIPTSTSR